MMSSEGVTTERKGGVDDVVAEQKKNNLQHANNILTLTNTTQHTQQSLGVCVSTARQFTHPHWVI